MLGKVMKYEFRSCARIVLPVFGIALGFSALMRLLLLTVLPAIWPGMATVAATISMALYTLLMMALIGVTVVAVVFRFYKSTTTGEAYLTFTLPVKTTTHLLGRVLVGLCYELASIAIAVVCTLVMSLGSGGMFQRLGAFGEDFGRITLFDFGYGQESSAVYWKNLPAGLRTMLISMLAVLIVAALIFNLMQFYLSVAIGSQMRSDRLLGSVVSYFVLSSATGIVMLVLTGIPVGIYLGAQGGIYHLANRLLAMDVLAQAHYMVNMGALLTGGIALMVLVISLACFMVTRYLFTRRLNLE